MREKIKLVSSAKTGHYYTTTKNKKEHPDKMETKKFDPTIRKHVLYKEAKIKQSIQTQVSTMPELPEVEVTKLALEASLKESVIAKINVRNKNLRWPVDEKKLGA